MAQFAEPIVSFLLESISKLLIEEGKHLLGVSDKAQQLQSELRLMLSLLKSADQRWQDDNATLREWISQSKDLAYEAENVLETLAFRISSRNVLTRSMCIFNECYMQHKIGSEILSINERMCSLTRCFHEFGISGMLEKEGPSSQHRQLIRRSYSHVEGDDFVGLGDDVKRLAEALVNEYEVVSICGMGGLGKTTIARKVYNHPYVRRHFDGFAWVYISQQWQTKDILVRILLKLIPEKEEEIQKWEKVDMLVQKLYRVQNDKKCLIVLDDIWSASAWNCMKEAFPIRENGSKILLTTRNKSVAIHIGPNGFHHEPRLLKADESWQLLQSKALKGRNFQVCGDIHEFEELGKEIVQHCKGLPLAVVVLGGILASKHDFNEWQAVSKNVKSYLKKGENIGEEAGEVQWILALSYNDLPYQLKPCFFYLGIYPEDYEIEAEPLYQLWMAERMVSEADRIGEESMMDTAERYLWELAKRSMVQVKVKEGPGIRKLQSCRLHDLMRDMCLRKGVEENFLKLIDYKENHDYAGERSTSLMGKIHRLVIFLNEDNISNYQPPKKEMVKHVRSLSISVPRVTRTGFRGRPARTQFRNFKILRALTIENRGHYLSFGEGLTDPLRNHFSFIGNLVHLRYLCVRGTTHETLPLSIRKLQHLETLDLRNCSVAWTTDIVRWLRNLRHLYLPSYDNCRCCGGRLHLAELNKLEIFAGFNSFSIHVQDLRKLINLQVLSGYIDSDHDLFVDSILNLPQLKEANLRIYYLYSARGLELLFCSNLQHLSLSLLRCGVRYLPDYRTDFFKYLIELQLEAELQSDPMETLEKLPQLQRLWMHDCFIYGQEMTCRAMGFLQLLQLSIERLYLLENWIIQKGAMPRLSHLHISSCHQLEMIPNGVRFLATLKELVIEDVPRASSRIQNPDGSQGKDFDNIRHVPAILLR